MKILCFAFGLGFIQVLINGFTDFIDGPNQHITEQSIQEMHWECPSCGHDNGDWTSICGKCGRSSRPK